LKRIRVMVVDDSLQFASAVGQFLASNGNFEVLMSANSGGEALARASTDRPDLMFIDISMPGMNGLAVTSLIKGQEAAPKVVMMTLEDSDEHRIGAMAAGADAFLPKDDFAQGFHAVLDLLFAKSSFSKESRVSDG
jgi:DNA-binding NarL/FixJ family response regulator